MTRVSKMFFELFILPSNLPSVSLTETPKNTNSNKIVNLTILFDCKYVSDDAA